MHGRVDQGRKIRDPKDQVRKQQRQHNNHLGRDLEMLSTVEHQRRQWSVREENEMRIEQPSDSSQAKGG